MGAPGKIAELPRHDDPEISQAVKDELARILAHDQFKDTTRLKRFLTYVVVEALEGRADRLKGYSVGLEVFDRPENFDPQADTIVRVQAGQLRRRLDLYYSTDGKNSAMRILLPKGSYVPVFENRQAVLAPPLPKGEAAQAKHGLHESDPAIIQKRPGVFVPTFSDLSAHNRSDYFAEGVTAEVINALVQFRHLRVIAGTGGVDKSYDGTLAELKSQFNAQFVLSGNVRRMKDLVRVSINLISTDTGDHVLSKIFDRESTPENLFEIQEEIASYTAAEVGAPFGAVNRYNRRLHTGRKTNMDGYHALLKYFNLGLDTAGQTPKLLLAEMQTVTKNTPLFSSAWAAQSLLHSFFVAQVVPNTGYEDHIAQALRSAQKAISIDPHNALAFYAHFVAAYHAGDFAAYEASAERGLSLNPNDYNMLCHYALTLAIRGQIDLAKAYADTAKALIATPPYWFKCVDATIAFHAKDYDAVMDITRDLTSHGTAGLIWIRMAAAGRSGRVDEVRALRDTLLSEIPNLLEAFAQTMQVWHPLDDFTLDITRGWHVVLGDSA